MTDRNPKPGEYWRTSSGIVVQITNNELNFNPPSIMTTGNGFCYVSDLIERVKVVPDPHPEPRVFWINVYALDGGSGFHTSGWTDHALADKHGGPDRIACVRVTEGQFDSEPSDAR